MGYAVHPPKQDTAAPWAPAPVSPGPGAAGSFPPGAFAPPASPSVRAVGVAAVPLRTVDVAPPESDDHGVGAGAYDVVAPEIYEVPAPAAHANPRAATSPEVAAPAAHANVRAAASPPAFGAHIPTSVPVRTAWPIRRWAQLAVAAAAAGCAVAAIGVGYAAFHPTGNTTPLAQLPVLPAAPWAGGSTPAPGGVPGSAPATTSLFGSPASPLTAPTHGATTMLQPGARVPPSPAGNTVSASPASVSTMAAPVPYTSVPVIVSTPPPPVPGPVVPLEASLSYNSARNTGTISITNNGRVGADDWSLTLTVPGGNAVTAHGAVSLSQSGERVTFAPGGGPVAARETFTFTFTVRGTPSGTPHDCAINGSSCH
ncbi:MAG: hypothetical protein QOC94_2781 [Actinoplanes sp.]|nr:hypothetical protein [Actinoplanes sp.]